MAFEITSIPGIMRVMAWMNGAKLMETWFKRLKAVAPDYSKPVTDVIKMDWALSYGLGKKLYDRVMSERIWENAAAQREIEKMLRRNGLLRPVCGVIPFGDLTQPVEVLDKDYINYRGTSGAYPSWYGYYSNYDYGLYDLFDMDDMTAALGQYVMRVVLAGSVSHDDDRLYEVTIDEVGVYIRDSYDFNGEQSLGYWEVDDGEGNSTVSPLPWGWGVLWGDESGNKVTNADFRKWRDKTQRGGDFLVFSDLKRTKLNYPHRFNIVG